MKCYTLKNKVKVQDLLSAIVRLEEENENLKIKILRYQMEKKTSVYEAPVMKAFWTKEDIKDEEKLIKMYSDIVYPYYFLMMWPLTILRLILKESNYEKHNTIN